MRYIIIPLLILLYIYCSGKVLKELMKERFQIFELEELWMSFWAFLHAIILGSIAIIGLAFFIYEYW